MKMRRLTCWLAAVACLATLAQVPATAEDGSGEISLTANVYELPEKNAYVYSDEESIDTEPNVRVSLVGTMESTEDRNEFASYTVESSSSVVFEYGVNEDFLSKPEEEWHLVEDSGKKINGITLDEKIQNGAVVVQISNDGQKWVTVSQAENILTVAAKQAFYETSELELLNGCYYRIIVAYKQAKKETDSKILFVTKENIAYKRVAEVYEFYLCSEDASNSGNLDNAEKVKLGKRIRTEEKGYTGQKDIDKDDPHYGWELGQFFVTGFTSKSVIDGTQYVLKNVGDTVTLGFYLAQDIDRLNDQESLSISDDKDGYDKAFEISPTDFGRGTLIIRYTDPDGVESEPQIYTNYLEANLSPRANTVVRLCEEGDYEVALDYEIQNDNTVVLGKSVLPEKTHYRIAFSFSVRNSNCMVYTFDNATKSELKNGSITENGFYIDLANSQYLDVSVKKEVLEEGADGLTEDTRFNRKAKDKEAYTDDGIYTITVKNKAAELESEKKIYVGQNKVLKAYMVTGLSISEIQAKVKEGATIKEDGTIVELSSVETAAESVAETAIEPPTEERTTATEAVLERNDEKTETKTASKASTGVVIAAAAVVLVIAIGIFVVMRKRSEKITEEINNKAEDSNL